MLSIPFSLFFEFVKVGLFTFGGGYGSLPFLYHICDKYNWFTHFELTQLIAISGLTPGPIGLNMATFAGFKTLGIPGAIISTFALVLPMIIITTQVFRLYRTFCSNRYVKKVLYFLRPTSCALIGGVGINLVYTFVFNNKFSFASINYGALILLFILYLSSFKLKTNPVLYMLIGGVFGVCVYLLN